MEGPRVGRSGGQLVARDDEHTPSKQQPQRIRRHPWYIHHHFKGAVRLADIDGWMAFPRDAPGIWRESGGQLLEKRLDVLAQIARLI